jgi:hypothetical protein
MQSAAFMTRGYRLPGHRTSSQAEGREYGITGSEKKWESFKHKGTKETKVQRGVMKRGDRRVGPKEAKNPKCVSSSGSLPLILLTTGPVFSHTSVLLSFATFACFC